MTETCRSRQMAWYWGSSGELTALTTTRKQTANSKWQVFKFSKPSLNSATNWGPHKKVQSFGSTLTLATTEALTSVVLMPHSLLNAITGSRKTRYFCEYIIVWLAYVYTVHVGMYMCTHSCLTGSCVRFVHMGINLKTDQNSPCAAHRQWVPLYDVFLVCYLCPVCIVALLLSAYPCFPHLYHKSIWANPFCLK